MTKRNLWIIPALMLSLAIIPAVAANAQTTYAGASFTVSTTVDTEYCGTGGVQCEGLGAPADGNSGRVRVIVQIVSPDLDPVSSFTADQFSIGSAFLPAGGSTPNVNTDCPSCFQSVSDGMYAVFLEPTTTWKSGTYVAALEIEVGPELTFYPNISFTIE